MRRLSLPMPLEDAPLVAFPVPLPRETSPLLAKCLISALHFYLSVTHLRAPDPFVMRSYLSCVMARGERARTGTGTRWMRPRRRGERGETGLLRGEGGREGGCTHYIFTTLLSTAEALIGWQTLDALLPSRQTPLLTPVGREVLRQRRRHPLHLEYMHAMRTRTWP